MKIDDIYEEYPYLVNYFKAEMPKIFPEFIPNSKIEYPSQYLQQLEIVYGANFNITVQTSNIPPYTISFYTDPQLDHHIQRLVPISKNIVKTPGAWNWTPLNITKNEQDKIFGTLRSSGKFKRVISRIILIRRQMSKDRNTHIVFIDDKEMVHSAVLNYDATGSDAVIFYNDIDVYVPGSKIDK